MNQNLLDIYLNTLNITNEIKTIDDINQLIKEHEKNFAFSSMKVLLKEDISLELEDIFENIVIKKRGGYCFEQNKLFYEVLKALGFDVQFYLARVVNNLDVEVPQTHRFTVLNFENQRYLIDVGIGFRSPSIAVKFIDEVYYSHLEYSYKTTKLEDEKYAMQIIKNDEVFTATNFDLKKCYEADFEMGNFYSSKHPCAAFVNNLVVSLIVEDEIRSLRNKDYIIIKENKEETIKIEDFNHFYKILKEDLNSNFTEDEAKKVYEKYVK